MPTYINPGLPDGYKINILYQFHRRGTKARSTQRISKNAIAELSKFASLKNSATFAPLRLRGKFYVCITPTLNFSTGA
jgi:hypothetical protein